MFCKGILVLFGGEWMCDLNGILSDVSLICSHVKIESEADDDIPKGNETHRDKRLDINDASTHWSRDST